jgi:hypothetical protein
LYNLAAEGGTRDVPGTEQRSAPFGHNRVARLFGVALFFRKKNQRDVGALTGVEHCHRPPDAGVSARN